MIDYLSLILTSRFYPHLDGLLCKACIAFTDPDRYKFCMWHSLVDISFVFTELICEVRYTALGEPALMSILW